MSFNSVIPLFKFRVLFRFDQSVGNLNKKRFQITTGTRNPCRFYFAVTLVIARAAASPGNKIFG